jgi:hypothetical protein
VTHALAFLLGCAFTGVLAWWWQRRPRGMLLPLPRLELPEIAVGVSAELATLASGIEGNAQLMCEAIAAREPIEAPADHLCAAVRRLRALSETIQQAAGPANVRRQPVRIEDVVLSVQHELEAASCGRFQIALDTASSVPEVHTDPRALRQTLLLLAEVLFGREPAAGTLTLRTRNSLARSAHAVVVQMVAEVEERVSTRPRTAAQLALAHLAADNLLRALGAEFSLRAERGVEATASITLPVAYGEEAAAAAVLKPTPHHDFGGALVLESDPAVRYMVGQELERTGRQVFLCADGVGARTMWRATPERFELLVVQAQGGRAPGEELVAEALATQPHTRAVLLGRTELPALAAALGEPQARVAVVTQPFGMMELRDALAHIGIQREAAG